MGCRGSGVSALGPHLFTGDITLTVPPNQPLARPLFHTLCVTDNLAIGVAIHA
jgi:hypothetical protein